MQEEIIQSVLDKQDTLALLPTGGGKSICFQIPSLCMDGITVVISPLIALMKDQVDNLKKRNIKAEAIYSGMPYREIDRIFDNCIFGDVKLLYISPERLTTDLAMERIRRMNLNFVAIDEAHCISQWGYDFRPAYLTIAEIRETLPNVHFIALTATATQEVVEDIQTKLEFRNGQVFQKSFSRSNLAYVVLEEENKEAKLVDIVTKVKGSGVVYVRNRRKTKQIAHILQKNNISADYYHAGLKSVDRNRKQADWIDDKIRIMVSTNAFGMGIDKSDVRTVVHLDLPDSLEAYFQEAGRGGRDEQKAFAVLLYNQLDRKNLEKSTEKSFPPIKEIKRVYQALGSYFQLAVGGGMGETFDFDIMEFIQKYSFDILTTYNALKILEQSGWLTVSESIFIPPSLKIIVRKDELYDYQLRNKKMDVLVKAILRSTHGSFNDFVNINERQLCNVLKISRTDLRNGFKVLQQDGMIAYRPMKDKPQMTLLEERVDAHNLTIDQELYAFRKKRHQFRIQKAIEYAEERVCRSKQLLLYFGEKSRDCGVCDVCLKHKSEILSEEDYQRYKTKIQLLLKREKLTINEVVDSFGAKRQGKVTQTLEYLLDEEILQLEDDKLFWSA